MSKAEVAEGGGSIEINTTHEHYTDFEIDGVAFRCYGDLVFKDGDNVRLYAYKSSKGYYRVALIKNFTRDFYVGPKVAKPTQDDDKDDDKNHKKSVFEIIGTSIFSLIAGSLISFLPILVVGWIVAFIVSSFVDGLEDLPFMTICIVISVVCGIVCAVASLMPESESAKQARKQREAKRKQQAQEQWAMYQNIINDNE